MFFFLTGFYEMGDCHNCFFKLINSGLQLMQCTSHWILLAIIITNEKVCPGQIVRVPGDSGFVGVSGTAHD